MKGWVYIITNESMPGLAKIGFSMKDPVLRANELSHTGVPSPYTVRYEILVQDPQAFEQRMHQELSQYREGKEWFKCDVEVIMSEIRKAAGDEYYYEEPNSDSDAPFKSDASFKSDALFDKNLPAPPGARKLKSGYVECRTCGSTFWPTYKHRCSMGSK